jgi:hypothetical protein
MLRLITDGRISPDEAVRAYHGILQGKGIKPTRPLADDLQITDQTMSYDGSAVRRANVTVRDNPLATTTTPARAPSDGGGESPGSWPKYGTGPVETWPKLSDGKPDFATMNSAQRRAYDAWRLQRIYG